MLKIITIPFDPSLGLFPDEALRAVDQQWEVLSHHAELFHHGGLPYWSVLLELRPRQGLVAAEVERGKERREPAGRPDAAERAAFLRLLDELDEVERARYQALLDWRAERSIKDGVPRYVILTNRQAMELARRIPRTLEELRAVRGIGKKKLKRFGRRILEVLHGDAHDPGPGQPAAVHGVDGDDALADAGDREVPQTPQVQPDQPHRRPGPGHPGGDHGGGLQPAAGRAAGELQPDADASEDPAAPEP